VIDIKKATTEVLSQPMNRKQFLARSGAALLVLVGVGSVIKALGGEGFSSRGAGSAYGQSAYGGEAKPGNGSRRV
jgi:hypothetical protein